jgi:radical SAM superfamily enzyme YgiQ (UPF0313 family)
MEKNSIDVGIETNPMAFPLEEQPYFQKISDEHTKLMESESNLKIVLVSVYCYANFPVRNFHSLVRENGIEPVSIFLKDAEANVHDPITDAEFDLFLDLIKENDPDLICFTVLTPYAVMFKDIINRVKKISNAPIVVGGKYPDLESQRCFEYLEPDYICKGEGEDVFRDMFDRLKKNKPLNDIDGLWWKNEKGEIVDQGMRSLNQDLDQFPFRSVGEPGMFFIDNDRISEDDPELYHESIWIMAGRGCVYQCSFCVNSVLIPMNKGKGKFVRMRSPERIIEELKYKTAKCKNSKEFTYIDEVFGVTNSWIMDFHEKYKDCGLNHSFSINLVPKQIKERNIAPLAEVGLTFIQTGIQSGVDHVRNDILNRPGSSQDVYEKAVMMKKYNIMPLCDMILENPFETAKDMADSIKLLLSLPKPLYLNTFKLQFYPSYPMSKRALEAGYITEDDLTEEACADVLWNRYNFIPTVFSLSRKNYLESCIYILGLSMFFKNYSFIQKSGEALARHLCQESNIFLGILANIIARTKYTLHSRELAPFITALDLLKDRKLKLLFKKSLTYIGKRALPRKLYLVNRKKTQMKIIEALTPRKPHYNFTHLKR